MTASAPRVSVVTSVYNEMPWLPVAIESVLNQTLTDFEFLLVSDGSRNGCPEALAAYAARDARIRVIEKENGGQVSGLNCALAEACAPYVARLDADDMMYPTRLEKQVAYLDAHPGVALVGSQVDWAGPRGTSLWPLPTDPLVAHWALLTANVFMGGGVTFRRDIVRALGGYDAACEYTEDYDLWLRIADQHAVVNLSETLCWFNNLRTTNGSTLHAERQNAVAERLVSAAIGRYVPGADAQAGRDLYWLLRQLEPPGDLGPRSAALTRIARAAGLLSALSAAFHRRHRPGPAAAAVIRADLHGKRMALRGALVRQGGAGTLARLYRPGWPRLSAALALPAALAR